MFMHLYSANFQFINEGFDYMFPFYHENFIKLKHDIIVHDVFFLCIKAIIIKGNVKNFGLQFFACEIRLATYPFYKTHR